MEHQEKCASCGAVMESRRSDTWRPKVVCSRRCAGLMRWAATGAAPITAQRDALIKALMYTEKGSTIAALLGTSRITISLRRQKLGLLHQQPFAPWSEEEKSMLADMAPCMSNKELSELLGRTAQSIQRCLKRNGIARPAAFYLERGTPVHAYPPELQEVIRLHNKVKRKLDEKEDHRRSARSPVRAA